MAEPFTIYKLTILYMLSKAGFPLSNTQISNFFLEQEYTDYFRVQEVIGDLVDANLIHAESTQCYSFFLPSVSNSSNINSKILYTFYSCYIYPN